MAQLLKIFRLGTRNVRVYALSPAWCIKVDIEFVDSDHHIDVGVVEERIKQIDVPTEVACKPRGIRELKHWKG